MASSVLSHGACSGDQQRRHGDVGGARARRPGGRRTSPSADDDVPEVRRRRPWPATTAAWVDRRPSGPVEARDRRRSQPAGVERGGRRGRRDRTPRGAQTGRPGRARTRSASTWSPCSWVTRTAWAPSRARGSLRTPGSTHEGASPRLEGDARVAPAGQAHVVEASRRPRRSSVASESRPCSQKWRNGDEPGVDSGNGAESTRSPAARPSTRTVAKPPSRSTLRSCVERWLRDPELRRGTPSSDAAGGAARRPRGARGSGEGPGDRGHRRRALAGVGAPPV